MLERSGHFNALTALKEFPESVTPEGQASRMPGFKAAYAVMRLVCRVNSVGRPHVAGMQKQRRTTIASA
jgi:hypothetical protein